MAPSSINSPAENKAHVIRELARDLRSSPRSLPSPSPTPVDRDPGEETLNLSSSLWEPSHDALVSTQQLDEETRPVLRSSARRFGYYNPPPPAPRIDTSMVAKEFKDFDQESPEDDDSLSIEMSRGVKRNARGTPGSMRQEMADLSPSALNFEHHDSLYDVTPPSHSRSARKSAGITGSLRRDAQIRRASTAAQNDPEPTFPTRGKTVAGHQRRRSTLSQMHSKVASEEDVSFNEERPPTITNGYKSSRFEGSRQTSQTAAAPSTRNTPQRQVNGTPRSAPPTGNVTQQSFMLPDLPNLTELVSGVFQDGTPVFSRSTKARSRFSSGPAGRFSNGKPTYPPIESVPIPSEEKALYASLQLLREKVAQLEHEKAEAERTAEEQEIELMKLRLDSQARQSRTARNSEDSKAATEWKTEKSKLETTIETLRARLDRVDRKLSATDNAQKRVTSDRDSLYKQLSTAFITSEELKEENDALLDENKTLRDEVDSLRSDNDKLRRENELLRAKLGRDMTGYQDDSLDVPDQDTQRSTRTFSRAARKEMAEFATLKAENDALKLELANAESQLADEEKKWVRKEEELRDRLDSKTEASRQFDTMTQQDINDSLRLDNENIRSKLNRLTAQRDEDRQHWEETEARLRNRIERRTLTQEFSRRGIKGSSSKAGETQTRNTDQPEQDTRRDRSVRSTRLLSEQRSRSKSKSRQPRQETMRSVSAPIEKPPRDMDGLSESESTTDLSIQKARRPTSAHATGADAGTITQSEAMDLTNLSFMGRGEIANLRRALEEERAAARRGNGSAQAAANETIRSLMSVKSTRTQQLPRKSSMKDLTARSQMNEAEATRKTELTRNLTQQATELSVLSNSSRRRRSVPLEMTSAFIIPDITVQVPQHLTTGKDHDFKNCTVCHRTVSGAAGASVASKTSVNIPVPVPVSSREDLGPDATMRPAQSPQEALAQVLKELEDELTHLKLELSTQEALLHSHDPALKKRQRKAIQARVQELLKAIDVKFDQIYALYDVLEGQKADGLLDRQETRDKSRVRMTEQEIDDTLRSVGLDPLEARKGKKVTINEVEESDDESLPAGSDFDDDLPWEGLSDGESMASLRRRRSLEA